MLTFNSGANSGLINFGFASTFQPGGPVTFQIELFGGDADTGIGSSHLFTQVLLWATAGNEVLQGTAGRDRIDGGLGSDTISGGGEGDALQGGLWRDRLAGGEDQDTVQGGADRVRLTGGGGGDTFQFATGDSILSARDLITDFGRGDVIRIIGAPGFAGTGPFAGAGSISHERDQAAGQTRFFFDADGDGLADQAIVLDGVHRLLAGDFGL